MFFGVSDPQEMFTGEPMLNTFPFWETTPRQLNNLDVLAALKTCFVA
jgi:hypothetical protein